MNRYIGLKGVDPRVLQTVRIYFNGRRISLFRHPVTG